MRDEDFFVLLKRANEADEGAIYGIMRQYEGLIIKNSIVNGKYDGDCRAYIETVLIPAIRKFKI